jgi:hypothetical protein
VIPLPQVVITPEEIVDECLSSKLEFASEIPLGNLDYIMLEDGSNPTLSLIFEMKQKGDYI